MARRPLNREGICLDYGASRSFLRDPLGRVPQTPDATTVSSIRFTRDKFRHSLNALLDEYAAMLVLLASMNTEARRQVESLRASIDSLSKRELQDALQVFKKRVQTLRRTTGATLPLGSYRSMLAQNPDRPGQVVMLPAYVAVTMFEKYPRIADALLKHELPFHAHIELDPRGEYEPQQRLQLQILEATLFEDMCGFWNDARAIQIPTMSPHTAKRQVKRLAALHRATVSAAFYMVEAYCNGIAFEAFLSSQDQLSERERELITEWDSKRSRAKYASLRDKILHYPRILVGAPAPLLQESNCTALDQFLAGAKKYRDAIVHASPRIDENSLLSGKVDLFLGLNHAQCGDIVDSAIELVKQIGAATGRSKHLFWLHQRSPDGGFPDVVFE